MYLAHRARTRLATIPAADTQTPAAASTTSPSEPDASRAVVAALTANHRAWLRDALDLLERHDIELVTGDFACQGFPEARPAATVLGALLLVRHSQLPFDYGPTAVPGPLGLAAGARLAAGSGEHTAAPYMRTWDAIGGADGSQPARRLLDAADAADTTGST